MLSRTARLAAPAAAIAAALLLSACSSNAYDAGTTEKYLKNSQKGKVRGLPLGEATCPEDLELKEGMTFRCTLDIAGVAAPYTVRLTNVDADKVQINLEPAKALIATGAVVDLVRGGLKPQYQEQAKISCGDEQLIVADPGTKIGCIVEVDGEKRQAVARVEDKDGKVVLVR